MQTVAQKSYDETKNCSLATSHSSKLTRLIGKSPNVNSWKFKNLKLQEIYLSY